jgi:TAG lipase/steryl ester hydrolase/phospholipase A2/LPA acyltransferase
LAFFNETRHAYGRSALLLSGGATLGLYHAGVMKALHDNGVLPKIVSGSSVGSIFAAILGTKTDEEFKDVVVPGKIQFSFFPSHKGALWRRLKRFLTLGYFMDIGILQECVRANVGDYTFAEAYARTGRVINIIVAPPNNSKELPVLLNYLTAPDVLIWSAACASCAIPLVYAPVELFCKDIVTGEIVPYFAEGVKWWDGSVSSDLPMHRLSELFNVNHFIVSQVNPHVLPFIFTGNSKNNVFHNLAYALGNELRTVSLIWYDMISTVFPYLKTFVNIASQKYSGDVTLYPAVEPGEFFKILTNPTEDRFRECVRKAELYTFRKLAMIKNHCDIEFTLDECVRKIRSEMILKEEIPLLEPSSEDGTSNPSNYLTSRIRSWSSEQFQLLQKSLDSHNARRQQQLSSANGKSNSKSSENNEPISRSQSTVAFLHRK